MGRCQRHERNRRADQLSHARLSPQRVIAWDCILSVDTIHYVSYSMQNSCTAAVSVFSLSLLRVGSYRICMQSSWPWSHILPERRKSALRSVDFSSSRPLITRSAVKLLSSCFQGSRVWRFEPVFGKTVSAHRRVAPISRIEPADRQDRSYGLSQF